MGDATQEISVLHPHLQGGNQGRTVFSGHDMTTALMNSQNLWLPAQGQPSRHFGIEQGEAP